MRTLIGTGRIVAQALYALMRLRPRRRKVVFLSRQADAPSRDFRMLADELRNTDASVEIVVRCRFVPAGLLGRVAYAGEVFVQMWHLANASVCIVDGYIIPVSILRHGPGLTVIQVWHALGAIKHFGLQSLGRGAGRSVMLAETLRMHWNYDYVLCGDAASVKAFAEAFGVEEGRVLTLGLPRLDYLADRLNGLEPESNAVADLRHRYPRLDEEGRMRVMFAPTFRRNRHCEFGPLIDALAGDSYTLIIKPHDLESAAPSGPHVVDASGVDGLDLLLLSDVVITDYSAIAFEAAAINRPVLFYVPDIENYRIETGLNLDPLLDLPEHSSVEVTEIVRMLTEKGRSPETEPVLGGYVGASQERSTAAIARLVNAHLTGAG